MHTSLAHILAKKIDLGAQTQLLQRTNGNHIK